MQLELPMFSQWHQCLDIAGHPANSDESCAMSNPQLWITWCRMKSRPQDMGWGIWTEKDVVDWCNATIRMEIENGI
jgi:hypothetical protein